MLQPWAESGVLDPDFDDDAYDIALRARVNSGGNIEVHPNDWGHHDGIGQYAWSPAPLTGELVLTTKQKRKIAGPMWEAELLERRQKPTLSSLDFKSGNCFADVGETPAGHTEEFITVMWFPHGTRRIATSTAIDFEELGRESMARRGIDKYTWLWRRSRRLAGYK